MPGKRRIGEFVPLDIRYDEDPAIVEASLLAELLFVRCMALAGRTRSDGYLSEQQIIAIAGRKFGSPGKIKRLLDELVALGPVQRTDDGGFVLRSWLKWNKSNTELGRERARDRERKAAERRREDDGNPPPVQPDTSRNPNGLQSDIPARAEARAPAGAGRRVGPRPGPRGAPRHGTTRHYTELEADHDPLEHADCNARDGAHTAAAAITHRYAQARPTADHGQALRAIAEALEHYPEPAVTAGVETLLAEGRTVTRGQLDIAINRPAPRTAAGETNAWIDIGQQVAAELAEPSAPNLRAIAGGRA